MAKGSNGVQDPARSGAVDGDHVLVDVDDGTLRGEWRDGVARFAGIPFGAAPIGDLRFRPPQPPAPWEGIRDATAFGAMSPQNPSMMDAVYGGEAERWDEDCLHLNVWTSAPGGADAALPVMVWIHGGAFEMGSGSSPIYDGTGFASDGVVYVSINYRLGALGFLDLSSLDPSEAGSGNVGLLDQVAALEWVHRNVAAFGGDPANVTVFGESAGSISISLLLSSTRGRGLFQKAILQSGALLAKAPAVAAADTAEFMATAGASTIAELRDLPVEELLRAHGTMTAARLADPESAMRRTGSPAAVLAFTPVTDGVVLPADPQAAIAAGSAAGIPLLVGTNLEEWKLFALMTPSPSDDDALRRRMTLVTDDVDGALDAYRTEHGELSPAEVNNVVLTDVVFRIPTVELADAQVAHAPVHQYRFDWKSPAWGGMIGAAHAVEIPFVFELVSDHRLHVLVGPDAPPTLASAMHDAWIEFATHGVPRLHDIATWPSLPADGSARPVVLFDEAISLVDDPEPTTRRFWVGA